MATSQNGWKATQNSNDYTPFKWITGRVNKNANVIYLLDDFCEWFNENIEKIIVASSWGYNYREIRGSSTSLSNHSSGTAIDLNAPKHPLGASGTFTKTQAAAIRKQLTKYKGAIRWGGDYSGRKDEMHFEINVTGAKLASIVKTLKEGTGSASKPSTSGTSTSKPSNSSKPSNGLTVSEVKSIQTALKKANYYKGVVDGDYGTLMTNAVKAYQKGQKYGKLKADGIWGSDTQKHFSWVKVLQETSNKWKGNKLVVDGDYGTLTANRVNELMKRNGGNAYTGAADGVPGPVFCKMIGISNYPL